MSPLESAQPSGFPPGHPISEIQASVELGRIQGYRLAIATLYDMTEFKDVPNEQLEADYLPENNTTSTTPNDNTID